MQISIVIPIYNGANYIEDLYQSLKNQTYDDFEVIYINDGSKDNSLKLLSEIARNDSRVSVYSQENKGICASRNLGIEKSHGEYLIFLDQDDGIENNLIEKYLEAITINDADLASFGKMHYFVENGQIVSKKPQIIGEELVTDENQRLRYLFNIDNKKRLMTIWNCIYRKNIIEYHHIRFDQHFKHGDEDGMFNIEYTLHCKKVFFSKNCYYHYYIRKGISTITKYNEELLENYLYYADKVYSLITFYDDEIQNVVKLYLLRFFSNVYRRFCKFETNYNERVLFLEKTKKSRGFDFATSLKVMANFKIIPAKYLYWDLFNTCYKKNMFGTAIALLELLLAAKKIS